MNENDPESSRPFVAPDNHVVLVLSGMTSILSSRAMSCATRSHVLIYPVIPVLPPLSPSSLLKRVRQRPGVQSPFRHYVQSMFVTPGNDPESSRSFVTPDNHVVLVLSGMTSYVFLCSALASLRFHQPSHKASAGKRSEFQVPSAVANALRTALANKGFTFYPASPPALSKRQCVDGRHRVSGSDGPPSAFWPLDIGLWTGLPFAHCLLLMQSGNALR